MGILKNAKKDTTNQEELIDPKADDRIREGREQAHEKKPFVFKPRGKLEIDPDVLQALAEKGFRARYVRWQSNGEPDMENLSEMEYRGYTPVTAAEMPKGKAISMQLKQVPGLGDILTKKDVCLMKIPVENSEAVKQHYREKAFQQDRSVNHKLNSSDFNNMIKGDKPIVESQVSTGNGRQTQFQN